MALETILVKDAAGTDRGVIVDKIGAGEDYVQVNKFAYGADGAVTPLAEKPATEAAQTTANTALGAPADAEATGDGSIVGLLKRARTLLANIATTLSGTLTVGGTVAVSNLPATQTVAGTVTATGPLTDAQLRAAAVPVSGAVSVSNFPSGFAVIGNVEITNDSGNAIPVSSTDLGAQADAAATTDAGTFSLIALVKRLLGKLPSASTRPLDNEALGLPVRPIGQEVWNVSFADSGASVLSADFTAPIVGTGITYNQGSSALNVVAGTTANAEFLTRSVVSWRGALRLKFGVVASQRIANNNFAVLLADRIGEGLAFTINSATSVTVTVPGHAFTAQSVGQFVNLGGIVGAAGAVPGRYAIASVVAGTSITFTVAGWPASGSGTLTLFGYSYVRNLFTGVTATNVAFDAQRRGWASGDTAATINTTASPGTVIHNELTGRECLLHDQLRASSTAPTVATRASRVENIPDDNLDLHVWIWNFNGTAAPASSTTFTLGFVAVEKFANTPVYLQGARANGAANPFPVSVQGTATVAGTVTANIGTGALAAGANAIGDVGIQVRANATGAASPFNYASPATPAGGTIKGGAGRLFGWHLVNVSAGVRWVKLFNQTAVTMGTTSAAYEFPIPAGGTASIVIPAGIAHTTGIMVAVTSARGLTDNNATGLALGDVAGTFFFA